MKIVVCSMSPSKLESVQRAFEIMFPNAEKEFMQHDSSSNIMYQPIGVETTMAGAKNRILSARKDYSQSSEIDFFVGIESGVDLFQGEKTIVCFSAISIYSPKQRKSKHSLTGTIELPYKIYFKKIFQDMEGVGVVTDVYFKKQDTKKSKGAFYLLTEGLIKREDDDREAIIRALVPFVSKHYK